MDKTRIRFLCVAAILTTTTLPVSAADGVPEDPGSKPQRWVDRDRIRKEAVTVYSKNGPQRRVLTMYPVVWSKVAGKNPGQSGIKREYYGSKNPYELNRATDCATGRGYTLNRTKWSKDTKPVWRWIEDSGPLFSSLNPLLFKQICGR